MAILSLAWPCDADHLEPPTDAAPDPVWPRVLQALVQGAGVVQIRCPDATEPERESLARALVQGAAAQGVTLDLWPGAGMLVVRRGVDERREDRQGPTMRTGH
jgi:thiamine monophosphate synthase